MRPKFHLPLFLLSIILLFGFTEKANAQIGDPFEVIPCTTYDDVIALIDSTFLNNVPNYAKKDITFYGDPTSVGYFKNGYFFGFDNGYGKGIVFTSGKAESADTPNICNSAANANSNNNGVENDADLTSLAGGTTSHDVAIIEFKFKPSADTIRFNYVFSSEEYHDYVFASFNDVFGFFLLREGDSLGPYTDNAKNIALIPGTHTAVSINSINFGAGGKTCTGKPSGCTNCEFFIDNSQQSNPHFDELVYDAYTTSLPAKSYVEQCGWYTIRLKVGDAGDSAFDTGVFLESGSFDLGTVNATPSYTHPTIDSLVYESCNNNFVNLQFNLSTALGFDYKLPYTIEGIAEEGLDYEKVINLEDTIYFPAGVTVDSIIFDPIYEDGLIEGVEDIMVIYETEMCNPFPSKDTVITFIKDKPYFGDTTRRYESYCEDTVDLTFTTGQFLTGIPPYSYEWQPGGFTSPSHEYIISGTDSAEMYCIVTDTCGRQRLDTALIISPPIYSNAGPDLDLCNQTSVQLLGESEGAQFFYWTSNPNDPSLAGQDSIPQPVVSPSGTTEYVLEVSDNCTHIDTDTTMALLEGASANAIASKPAICIGDATEITINSGATGESYVWTSSPADPSLVGQEGNQVINVTPTAPTTTYSVTVTNACGFTESDDITIIVNLLPNAMAGTDDAICFGDSFGLQASGGLDYVWTSVPADASLIGQDSIYNPVVTPATQEDYIYTVQVTDGNGCVNTDEITLQVDPVPSMSLDTPDDFICFGETVTIEAVGTATDLTWTSDPFDPDLAAQQGNVIINVSPDTTTVYTLVGKVAGFDCPATLEQTITVKPQLFSTFEVANNIACENQAFYLNYTGNAGGGATYNWDFDGAIVNSGSGSGPYDIQWDLEGPKTVSLQVDEDNCSAEPFSLNFDVVKSPVADFMSDTISGCAPLEIEFSSSSTNMTDDVTYNWDLGNGSGGSNANASTTYSTPGQYNISLTVTNQGICSDTKTLDSYIDVNETPVADFNPVPPESILEDDAATIDFSNTSVSSDALSYFWEFGEGSTSTEQSPSHVYTQAGIYLVVLDIATGNGCVSHVEKEVTIHPDFVVYAPNSFSPNGDGLNDYFEIKGIGLKSYNLKVYSRWGELMFESDNIEDQWDGKYNGEYAPAGTYVYTITYTSMLDKNKTLEGTVTILK